MKTFYSILVSLTIGFSAFSQQITTLEKELDSLRLLKNDYQKKLDLLQIEYLKIESAINQIKLDEKVGEVYICSSSTNISKTPDKYEVVIYLPKNSKVKLLDQNKTHYKINFKDSVGWVLKDALIPEKDVINKINEKKAIEKSDSLLRIENKKIQESELIKRKASMIKKYGTSVAEKILSSKFWLGMTSDMAIESLGLPDKNNRTIGSWGVHEQWIYERRELYLYFENGTLTSWQD
jgi:hypothetical protein